MAEKNEYVLCVPVELTRRFTGLSIDAGASVVKFVYKSTEDHEEANSTASKCGHLRLVSFPRRELAAALEYVRQRSVITREDSERPTIRTTGVGCTQHGKLITDTFGIRLQQMTEYDCFVKSFAYLAARLPRTEFLEPFLDEAIAEPVKRASLKVAILKRAKDLQLTQAIGSDFDENAVMAGIHQAVRRPSGTDQERNVPLSEAEPDMYPCLLAMCGSVFVFFKVEQDGSFNVIDMSNRGGRTFHGVGAQLTGYKTFSELIEAASKGDQRGLDQFYDEVLTNREFAEGDESLYSTFVEDVKTTPGLLYCFGKAADSEMGEFKREDSARAWLNCFVLDLVQCVQLVACCHAIKRVFFAGSFCSTPLVRSIITTQFARRNLSMLALRWAGPFAMFDFVKPGAHLGALGCAVYDAEKSTSSS